MVAFVKVAHRGASGNFPENTQLAFEKAIEAGVDMIEMDCQLTRDGHVVVFHDERLRRTAGASGTVRSKSLEQLTNQMRPWNSSSSMSGNGRKNRSEENGSLHWKRFWRVSQAKLTFASISNSSKTHNQGSRSNSCLLSAITIIWIKPFFRHSTTIAWTASGSLLRKRASG